MDGGAGAINTGINNYVGLHYTAKHMNFLHCFYGLGITGCLSLMSIALSKSRWRMGYVYAFIVELTIAIIFALSFKLWNKDGEGAVEEEAKTRHFILSITCSYNFCK